MTRDLQSELFNGAASSEVRSSTSVTAPKEITLSELADLSELAEEQAKVRLKVTHLSARTEAIADSVVRTDKRFHQLKDALRSAVSKLEGLSTTDDLQAKQLGELGDGLRNALSQLEAHTNALAFLRNSDGQQQQSIERLKQSRVTLTHILLFGILLCAGSAIALDIDKAFNLHHRLDAIEQRFYPYP